MPRRSQSLRSVSRVQTDYGHWPMTGFFDVGLFMFALGAGILGVSLMGGPTKADMFYFEQAAPVSDEAIILWINQQELVSIDGEILQVSDLRARVVGLKAENPVRPLFLMAHPDTPFKAVLNVRQALSEREREWHGSTMGHTYIVDRFYITG